MKTALDPRHRWRINQFRLLYQYLYQPDKADLKTKLAPILTHLDRIDTLITHYAPEWPIDKINKVDLSILRLAIFELLTHHAPYKVVIDEAVEIAKRYGSDRSAAFINGVLGKIVKQEDFISHDAD